MKNLKLTAKFAIVVVPTFLLIFILTFLISSTAKSTKNSTEEVLYDRLYIASSNLINADRDYYQAYVSTILREFNSGNAAELQADIDENYQQTYDRVTEAMNSLKSDNKLYNEYTLEKLASLNGATIETSDQSAKPLNVLYTEFIEKLDAWKNSKDEQEGIQNFSEARDRLNAMEDIVDQYATYELAQIDKNLSAKITGIVIAVIIAIVIITLLVGYVLLGIINGINKVNKSLSELANNNLNFEPAVIPGKDELATMSNGVITVKEALLSAITSVNTAADNLSDSITAVSDGNLRSSDGVSIISSSIDEVSQTSQQVANSAVLLNEKSLEMSDAIESITYSISNLQTASSQINSINQEATASMNNVMDSSELSVDAVNDITKQISDTNEAVSRIVECIQVISDISSQTNLLSLNASIEAARAGESGRGFAVVAQEIRSLADSCATSAEEIRAIVNDVTAISEKTVVSAKHVSDVIEKQQNDVRFTQEKFSQLSEAVEQNRQGINNIQTMATGLEKIRTELADSTSTLSAISEELGASAEEVSATCTQVATDCESTMDMSNTMTATKGKLLDAVSVFKL